MARIKKTTPVVLTPEAIAMIASGVSEDEALETAGAPDPNQGSAQDPGSDPTASATDAGADPANPAGEAVAEGAGNSADPATPASAAVDPHAEVVAFLREELRTANAGLVAAQVALAQAQNELAALNSVHGPLCDVVREATSTMSVALRNAPLDLREIPAEALLAQHAKIKEEFHNRFPVGGRSALSVDPTATQMPGGQEPDITRAARLRAVSSK